MGQDHPKMNPIALKSALRQAKGRINIRRGQKVNNIAKKKKEIRTYLESGNETMAFIHVEPLINDERMIPCFDIIAMLCDAVLERMPILERKAKEIPPDMYVTLHTLIYAADRAGIDELYTIKKELTFLCGKEFAAQAETDDKCVHEVVKQNINLIMPEEGWKVERLIQIARDEGIQYSPTEKSQRAYNKYLDGKAGTHDISQGVPSPFPLFPQMPSQGLPLGPYPCAPNFQPMAPPQGPGMMPMPPSMLPSGSPMMPPGPPSMPPGPPSMPFEPQGQPPMPPNQFYNPGPYPTFDMAPGPVVIPGLHAPADPNLFPSAAPGTKPGQLDDLEARLANLKKL